MCSKTLAWYRSPQCHLESIQCGASDHTFRECIPGNNNCLGEERTFKIVSPALVCCEGRVYAYLFDVRVVEYVCMEG